MGTWMATIRFPDGTERYARYSTVVAALASDLYQAFHVEHHRAEPTGEPLPTFPERPHAPIDELIPVVISPAPDDCRWHAVYCPRQQRVLGPVVSYHFRNLQGHNELTRGSVDGRRHLSQVHGRGLCGAPVLDTPLPYRNLCSFWGPAEERPEEPPDQDLFAEWDSPDICRECLLRALDQRE
ncbi:hypothetical protein Acy02nite_48280 [Actinoplanes cyaneus]|uniref:Uncharacterized protein n=1 Tax=Actinoplanes cyaneus TaxID=52696 RepID=A0A919IMB3_9ACTN|nr:hypothetical protein [Actinoplanes cyaneus]MCW2138728.1 hypothetical protein [Actinoplanes cyaneus]GID66947.1 hypothetical protein Acy02nite_48280 [Actinoplanes cyaneus]